MSPSSGILLANQKFFTCKSKVFKPTSRTMQNPPEPILAPPGAGLPVPERWIARGLFSLKRRFASRASVEERFRCERSAIRHLVDSIPESLRDRPVLIPRLRGLEDSSRHWSVWMTLDHLRITNRAFAGVITALAAGKVPPGKADTATVKPSPQSGPDADSAYEASCGNLLEVVARIPDLKTALRYEHPWFGPLDAAGWHALAAMHLGIHRAQIEAISKGLPPV